MLHGKCSIDIDSSVVFSYVGLLQN